MKSKLLVSAALATACTLGTIGAAGAQVTDYDNYPANSGVPEGCDYLGITGVAFSQELGSLVPGDVLTMTWDGVSPECNGSPVTLAVKTTPAAEFDPEVNQYLHPNYSTGTLVSGEGGSLSFEMPDLSEDDAEGCFYQIDAVLGQPLSIVGPDGSFYGSGLRGGGPHLLIAAAQGSHECLPPVEPELVPPPVVADTPPPVVLAPVVPVVAPVAPPVPTGTDVPAVQTAAALTAPTVLSAAPLGATPTLPMTGARGESVFLLGLIAFLVISAGAILIKNWPWPKQA